jgi:hypothetical protein
MPISMATAVPVQVLSTFQKNTEFTSTLYLLKPALSKKKNYIAQ